MTSIDYLLQTSAYATFEFPQYQRVQHGLEANLQSVRQYVRQSNHTVPSDHILSRIIGMLHISDRLDVKNYFHAVEDVAYEIANALHITNPFNAGKPHTGDFFGPQIPTYLHAVNGSLPLGKIEHGQLIDFENIEAVKIIKHPYTDLSFNVPDGQLPDKANYGIVEIDIPLLALQYRQWYHWRLANDSTQTIKQFIYTHVLTNTLKRYNDLILFNRYDYILNDLTPDTPIPQTRYRIIDWDLPCLQAQTDIVDELIFGRAKDWRTLIAQVPLSKDRHLLDIAAPANTLLTAQNEWLIVASQMPLWRFLATINDLNNSRSNRQYINQILRTFKSLNNNNAYKLYVDEQVRSIIDQDISFLTTMLT